MYRNHPIDPALRLQPGQEALTPAQEAEAKRFAAERIAAQLSTEPVDEREAEALLNQAYAVAQVPPPIGIHWVDGPLQLVLRVAALVPQTVAASGETSVRDGVLFSTGDRVGTSVRQRAWASIRQNVRESVRRPIEKSVPRCIQNSLSDRVAEVLWHSIWESAWEGAGDPMRANMRDGVWGSVGDSIRASMRAYVVAPTFAYFRFFDCYLAPNGSQALARFNELVSGYWLGSEEAVIVRRPRMLAYDQEGRLHNATGKCLEYHDGWGCYAWHGVRVPERVIRSPETLTRADFLQEEDEEVRRVIIERMGERFVSELNGRVLDVGSRGTLYAVYLPELDPEDIVTYLQVEDASMSRQYFLRVPSTVQTADDAVVWLEMADEE